MTTATLVPCIATEQQYDEAQKRLIELGKITHQTDSQKLEFKTLALLINNWENENMPELQDFDPIDYLECIMEGKGLRHTDMIPILGPSSRVSEVLNRKRPLTLKMIRNLHKKLNIPLDILVKPIKLSK